MRFDSVRFQAYRVISGKSPTEFPAGDLAPYLNKSWTDRFAHVNASSETQGQIVGRGKVETGEQKTGLFFAQFFCLPVPIFPHPTIYPWVSEDDVNGKQPKTHVVLILDVYAISFVLPLCITTATAPILSRNAFNLSTHQ